MKLNQTSNKFAVAKSEFTYGSATLATDSETISYNFDTVPGYEFSRLVGPIATKMGVTTDELIQKIYSKSSSGDWSEFCEQAKELRWANHIVNGIDETAFTKDLDSVEAAKPSALTEEVDPSRKAFKKELGFPPVAVAAGVT